MRRTVPLAATTVLWMFEAMPLIRAEQPRACRDECSVELQACKGECTDSGGFEGCDEACGWVYEYRVDRCR